MIAKIFNLKSLPEESETEGLLIEGSKPQREEDLKGMNGEYVGYFSDETGISLYRDRLGARNLYYLLDSSNYLVISTDIDWILHWALENTYRHLWERGLRAILNFKYIYEEYLQFQVPFSDQTIYRNIYRVRPAEVLRIDKAGVISKRRYWDLKFGNDCFRFSVLYDLLLLSVLERKPIKQGAKSTPSFQYTSYLSGGIDSSSVACMADPIEVFSGFYKQEEYSELNYIKTITEEFGFIENRVEIKEDDFYEVLIKLPYIIPDPMCGLGIIPQVIVAQAAKEEGYSYAFTGEGGDEIFYGYPWNNAIIELAKMARNRLTRDRFMIRWDPLIEKILTNGFLSMVATGIAKTPVNPIQVEKIMLVWDQLRSVEDNVLKVNVEIGLPAILTIDERVGIYSGVTSISPLSDYRVVDYVASINSEERTKIPKYLLREAMTGILPEKVRSRYDKMGFPVPLEEWSWPMIPELMSSLKKRNLFPVDLSRQTSMNRETWALINLELICQKIERGN